MAVFNPRQMLVRSLPILSCLVILEMLGGSALAKSYSSIRPVFLMLLPPFIAVGGNVGSVFGSRVSSALHLGLIQPGAGGKGPLRSNLVALTFSGLVSYLCLGFFVFILSEATGMLDLGLSRLMLITLLSGGCLTLFTIAISLWTCFTSFRRGLDPDDIVVPVVTTLTDFVGIILLLSFIALLGT